MPLAKPTAVLAFTGAFKKDPARGRARAGEPQPRARLAEEPPAHLDADSAGVWAEIMAVVPLDVLGNCDALAVEVAARLTVRMRTMEPEDFNAAIFTQLMRALGELGMSPLGRVKIKMTDFGDGREDGKTGNAFADL